MSSGEDVVTGNKTSAATRAYQHLVRSVELRLVLPGERLPTAAALAQEIGVSRPAVLHALQRMQEEGRIEIGAGRKGVTVLPAANSRAHRRGAALDKNWAELSALVEITDPGIARVLARQGLTADVVAEARELIEQIKVTEDEDALLGLHNRFHLLLARATGMKILEALGTMGRQLLSGVHDLADIPVAEPRVLAAEHEQLLTAILAGDAARASDIAAWHVDATRDALRAVFGGTPFPERPRRTKKPARAGSA